MMRLVLWILILFGATLKAQEDSLLAVLKNTRNDTNRVKLLCQLSELCEEKDILKYAEPALALSEKLNFKKGIKRNYFGSQ
jgi:hypothetical protein